MKIEGVEISLVKHYEVGDVLNFQQEGKEHIKVLLVEKLPDKRFVGFSLDCLNKLRQMNKDDSNSGGFNNSDLCWYLNTEFLYTIPDKLRDCTEAVRIPCVEEVFGRDDNFEDVNITQNQLELMKARRNRIAFRGCDSDEWCWYWLMNKKRNSAADFANVYGYGNVNYYNASVAGGVRPVFLLNL